MINLINGLKISMKMPNVGFTTMKLEDSNNHVGCVIELWGEDVVGILYVDNTVWFETSKEAFNHIKNELEVLKVKLLSMSN
jgi:hypothetical protein